MIFCPSMRSWFGASIVTHDPYFASVVQLAHYDGANNSTTFTNSCPRGNTITLAAGSPQDVISTAQSVFGGASFRHDVTVPPSSSATHTDYEFGSSDLTIEFRYRPDAVSTAVNIWDMRSAGTAAVIPVIYSLTDGTLIYFVNGADRITSATGVIVAATWAAIALSRVSGTTRMFVDGTQVGSNYTDGNNYNVAARCCLGSVVANSSTLFYGDDLRVTNGVGRYAANYSLATSAFPDS